MNKTYKISSGNDPEKLVFEMVDNSPYVNFIPLTNDYFSYTFLFLFQNRIKKRNNQGKIKP